MATQKKRDKISNDKPSGKGDSFKVNDHVFFTDIKQFQSKATKDAPNLF